MRANRESENLFKMHFKTGLSGESQGLHFIIILICEAGDSVLTG